MMFRKKHIYQKTSFKSRNNRNNSTSIKTQQQLFNGESVDCDLISSTNRLNSIIFDKKSSFNDVC